MKNLTCFCILLFCSLIVLGQKQVSEIGIELLDLFAPPAPMFLEEQARSRAQVLDIRDREIVLDLYTDIYRLDTIIEKGKYLLFIKHDKDILQLDISRNGSQRIQVIREDNQANALYRGLRSKVTKPILRFRKGTTYIIEIQLKEEGRKRAFRIKTRHPKTTKPIRAELGTPLEYMQDDLF